MARDRLSKGRVLTPLLTVGVVEITTPSAGGAQLTKLIPERDVYRLIMRSRLPAAEEFEDWVVGTVLPSIRKNGGYVARQPTRRPQPSSSFST